MLDTDTEPTTTLLSLPSIPSLSEHTNTDDCDSSSRLGDSSPTCEQQQEPQGEGKEAPLAPTEEPQVLDSTAQPESSRIETDDPLAVSTDIAVTTTDTCVLAWSHVLASPALATFSPALPVESAKQNATSTSTSPVNQNQNANANTVPTLTFDNNNNSSIRCSSFHGAGLQLAVSRAKQTTRCSRRCVALLLDVTTLWEQYAQAIFKAGQSLQPMTTASSSTCSTQQTQLPTLSVQESTLSWSREWIKLAHSVRETITKQWKAILGTHTDAITIVWAAYTASRTASETARQRALVARNKYYKAVDDAEAAVREWKEKQSLTDTATAEAATDDESNTTTPPAVSENASTDDAPPVRVTYKLKQVQRHLAKYQQKVAAENSAVQQCHRLEGMALESMQNVEEDRVLIFVNALRKTLTSEREALNEMVFSLKDDADEKGSSETLVSEKKGGRKTSNFANLMRETSSRFDTESSGVMDAETLGLPEEVGKLRDQVRVQITARGTRVQVVRGLATFLENVSTVSAKLGTSLKQLIDSGGSSEPLEAALQACEGPRVLGLWTAVMKTIEQEAEAALSLASALRSVRSQRLDNVLLYGEKSMKAAAESDEAMWKNLCEAARAQSRAENRYRQNTAHAAKARERVRSVDSDAGGQPKPTVSPKKVNKHLANMFSILPDAGGHAMKMLAPGARAGIAQRNLEDAGQKESKGRQLLDMAVETTSQNLNFYKSSAEALSSKYEEEDKAGWDDVKFALESFVTRAESLRQSRAKALEDMKAMLDADALAGTVTDINEWAIKTQGIIANKVVLSQQADTSASGVEGDIDSGFMLEVNRKLSDTLVELLRSVEAEKEETASDDGENVEDAENECVDDKRISPSNSADGEDSTFTKSPSDAQLASMEERQTPKWIRRSLSAPNPTGPLRPTLSLGEKMGSGESIQADAETEIFLKYFWPDKVDPKTAPPVINSFSCSFRDSNQRLPSQYGRLFVTSARLVFVSWSQKRLVLRWAEVVSVETAKNFVITGDNHLMLTYNKGKEESNVLLGGFTDRQQAFDLAGKLREEAKAMDEDTALSKEAAVGEAKEDPVREPGFKAPPDTTLQKMDVVLSKHLRNVSIQRYYEIAWSEGNGTDEKPLYGPWLKKAGFDVEVGDWELSETVGAWCKERYPQKRTARFKVKRRTHLYIGPPIAGVNQTHYCRLEGNDKCVIAMTVELEGIPYSDTFAVEVRWVATREGLNDILVEVGLFVDFRKNSFLKKPIRAGTIEETTPIHKNLFEVVKSACIAAGGVEDVEEEKAEEEAKAKVIETPELGMALRFDRYTIGAVGAIVLFIIVWRFLLSSGTPRSMESFEAAPSDVGHLNQRIDRLEDQIKTVQATLDEILAALKNRGD
jgi:hypothetical protein